MRRKSFFRISLFLFFQFTLTCSAIGQGIDLNADNGTQIIANNGAYGLRVENENIGDGIRAIGHASGGNEWAALYVYNVGTSPGIVASTNGTYSGYFYDSIYVNGSCVGCDTVYVGKNAGADILEAGDLVAIEGLDIPLKGTKTPLMRVRLAGSNSPIIGVVKGKARLVESGREGEVSESAERADGPAMRGDLVFVVVQGMTYVKATAFNNRIAVGDRLTAADEPGHARAIRTTMMNNLLVSEGARVIGIALEPLEYDTDLLPVLVTLR